MYDLAVIGAGWAGFNAALKAKQSGLSVALIERGKIGGTCLNRGCIPTKSLQYSSKVFSLCNKAANFGVSVNPPSASFLKIQERKNKIVGQLEAGMRSLLKGCDLLSGEARILSPGKISVSGKDIEAGSTIIATGSRPSSIPGFAFDGEKIFSSDEILNFNELPESILIIGGGVIGCEFAGILSALGSKVTITEKMPQLLPTEDPDIAKKLETVFKKKGIKVNTSSDAAQANLSEFSHVLVCVGRAPEITGLGLENAGVKAGKYIEVDEYLRTTAKNIYAAGDCTGKIMLAHYAAYQGKICAHNIAESKNLKKSSPLSVPSCIFTDPEIASAGLREEEARKSFDIEVRRFDFLGSGMARIIDESDGFIKVIIDKTSRKVMGGSIIGPRATELIAVLNLAVSASLTAEQLSDCIFAHPTLSECISEALN